ncbi:MAG: hypothetical protein ACR2PA_07705 [Hyphomicrobiaceae bacterium]
MIAIIRWAKAPMVLLIGACWLGFAIGFVVYWADGVGAGLLAGVIAGNVSTAAAAATLAIRAWLKS